MALKGTSDNMVASSNSNNIGPNALQLKDLDVHILKKIFKNLLVMDLVNIIEYDADLQTAAVSAFKEIVDKSVITVTNKFHPQKESISSSIKLLMHFGNEITKLVVRFEEEYREMSKVINDKIASECRALQEIEFQGASRFSMFGISQHFGNVQTVCFQRGSLCEIVSQFGTWFPKAHTLKLFWQKFGKYSDCLNVEKNLSLKHLEIGKLDDDRSSKFLRTFIEQNPELETLRIEMGYECDIDLVDTCINAKMPNLESLSLNLKKITGIYNRKNVKPHFINLKHLTVELACSSMKSFLITTENLQTLKLCSSKGFVEDCGKFLINNKNAETVELDGPYIKQANDVISSISKLSNLKEIKFPFPHFEGEDVQLDQVHTILKECKRLKKLTIIAQNIGRKEIPVVDRAMNAFAASVELHWKASVLKEVIPIYKVFHQIDYRLSLERKQSERDCRMEQRMKRKTTSSHEINTPCKKLKTIKKQLQLENLNDDCLIVIFKVLSIDDLVHIVQYNKHFIAAARIAFKQKYGNDEIQISVEYNSTTKTPLWCIELLKYFGSEIAKLRVQYYDEDSSEIDDSIDNAVIMYCRKCLVEIEFINVKKLTMNGLRKPFENIRVVSFVRGCINELIYNFRKWFPNANTLKLKSLSPPSELKKINMKTLPTIQHFEFHTCNDDFVRTLSGQIIVNNPQLKSLYCCYNSYNHKNVSAHQTFVNFPMPDLESLHLISPNAKQITPAHSGYDENGKFHFKMLKDLHIQFKDSGVLRNLPISSNDLETLTLIGLDNVRASDCVNLIHDNKSVKSIKIAGSMTNHFQWSAGALFELFPKLPNLNELELSYDNNFYFLDSYFDIESLLENCKSLLKVVINCDSQRNGKKLEVQFNKLNNAIKSSWIMGDMLVVENDRHSRYRLTFKKIFNIL